MSEELGACRKSFAEELATDCELRTASLVEALATIPREGFLRPGPWLVRGEGDFGEARRTADADPRHVYANVSIAIDADRQLFNGSPAMVAPCIDALGLGLGERVLHVGAGTGYYSAIMAHCVGPEGGVVAVEVDEELASEAQVNLETSDRAEVRHGTGTEFSGESYDAILVSAGMTHPHEAWLDALTPTGRLVLPLTFATREMGTLGKGVMVLISKRNGSDRQGGDDRQGGTDTFAARVLMMTMIYSALGIRDEGMNERLLEAFTRGGWPTFDTLRRDPHEPADSCWLHGDTFCLGTS